MSEITPEMLEIAQNAMMRLALAHRTDTGEPTDGEGMLTRAALEAVAPLLTSALEERVRELDKMMTAFSTRTRILERDYEASEARVKALEAALTEAHDHIIGGDEHGAFLILRTALIPEPKP